MKSPEQLQAEAAYQNLIRRLQEQQQAKEHAERLARDYNAGILYVTPEGLEAETSREVEVGK